MALFNFHWLSFDCTDILPSSNFRKYCFDRHFFHTTARFSVYRLFYLLLCVFSALCKTTFKLDYICYDLVYFFCSGFLSWIFYFSTNYCNYLLVELDPLDASLKRCIRLHIWRFCFCFFLWPYCFTRVVSVCSVCACRLFVLTMRFEMNHRYSLRTTLNISPIYSCAWLTFVMRLLTLAS